MPRTNSVCSACKEPIRPAVRAVPLDLPEAFMLTRTLIDISESEDSVPRSMKPVFVTYIVQIQMFRTCFSKMQVNIML